MAGLLARLNETVVVQAVNAMGTVWCVYAFALLGLLPVVAPALQAQILYVSNCFQLVALPLLMVGQALNGREAESQRQQDHAAIIEELALLREVHARLGAIQQDLADRTLSG